MYKLVSWKRVRFPAMAVALIAAVAFAIGTAERWRPTAAASADSVCLPIIMYHGILKEDSRQGQYIISPALFDSDLQYIRQLGYTTVVMQDLIDHVDQGTPLPEKPIMLTFDDGYYNNYLFAYPLLQKYNMKAVISPVVSWSKFYSEQDSDHAIYSHITWDEIREMAQSGLVEIQNHSFDMHYCTAGKRKGTLKRASESTEEYQTALREDLQTAQEHLERLAGVKPNTFTYPYGAVCDEAKPVIRELGFRATLRCESRINRITSDPECLYDLGRYLRPAGTPSATYFNKIEAAVKAAQG